ncbi:MAG: aspartate dehydrogenase domain-containing protein [Candidatus Omnitrophota bacterium]
MIKRSDEHKHKIGILGCGAIGSHIAAAVIRQLQSETELSAIYDIVPEKAKSLSSKLGRPALINTSIEALISASDFIVEAINSPRTNEIIDKLITAKKDMLVMSVGQLLLHPDLLKKAAGNGSKIIIPSGAIAGIDAIKAAKIAGIKEISITTKKPVQGLLGAPYLKKKGLDLQTIKEETEIFSGGVLEAIKAFPQNINVAATVALAADVKDILRIRICTSPAFKYNVHEIRLKGDFGEIMTVTQNVAFPDNPKTSYLAALSGVAALRSFYGNIKIGT